LVAASQEKHCALFAKTTLVIFCGEMIAVHLDDRVKYMNATSEGNA
jgi:hypothetical protein